jgi:hypothetical protein
MESKSFENIDTSNTGLSAGLIADKVLTNIPTKLRKKSKKEEDIKILDDLPLITEYDPNFSPDCTR